MSKRPLKLGEESLEPDEATQIATVQEIILETLRKAYAEGSRPARRDAHPKHHGVVRAELNVEPDLPAELRVGLFREGKRFRAYVRFSNGQRDEKPDVERDARGMAIKVLGVEGEKLLPEEKHEKTQDFLLVTHHSFFVRNIRDYVELFRQVQRGKPQRFFLGPNPFRWRLKELGNANATRTVIANPLGARYWSTVPFAFGGTAARFSMRPRRALSEAVPSHPGPDYLREAMSKHLDKESAEFDFLVQLQTDPVKMPIEDPRVPWDEHLSPYRKVATLVIPPQTFESKAQMDFAENLSFTPWHCLPEHRPLGGVNRARRPIYAAISTYRHEMNGAPRREPTGDEQFGSV